MFEKSSNTKLILILIALLFVIGIIKWFDYNKNIKPNQKQLISIDTSRVTAIYMYPQFSKEKETVLFFDKKDERWEVKINDNFGAPADKIALNALLTSLTELKSDSIVAKSDELWEQYKVDSSGTKMIVVYDDKKRALELVVGKAEITSQSIKSYIRISGAYEVYAVNSPLSVNVQLNKDTYRDIKLFSSEPDSWSKLIYLLPAFGDYEMVKKDFRWYINGIETDSVKTQKLLSDMNNSLLKKFNSEYQSSDLKNPDFSLFVKSKSGTTDTLKGFVVDGKELLTSSTNPVNVIDAKQGNLFEKIFIGKTTWFDSTLYRH